MIVEAIKNLNMGESGSSKQAIVKMVRENYALGEKAANEGVKAAPRQNVTNNNLWQVTGQEAGGGFALIKDKK